MHMCACVYTGGGIIKVILKFNRNKKQAPIIKNIF